MTIQLISHPMLKNTFSIGCDIKKGIIMNEKKKSALINIYKSGRGYLDDLRKTVDSKYIEEFITAGFIICGFTRKSKTWRISSLGKGYVEDLELA